MAEAHIVVSEECAHINKLAEKERWGERRHENQILYPRPMVDDEIKHLVGHTIDS